MNSQSEKDINEHAKEIDRIFELIKALESNGKPIPKHLRRYVEYVPRPQ